MTMAMMNDAVPNAKMIVAERLAQFPGHPLFLFAKKEIDRIVERIAVRQPLDQEFYDSLNVGQMCARELETVDMPFCQIIYDLLDAVRPGT